MQLMYHDAIRTYATPTLLHQVKNQGQCQGCWAWATAAAMESSYLINGPGDRTNLTLDFSESDLISCSGAGSCAGGGGYNVRLWGDHQACFLTFKD